jgi:predicted MFS family arabinose efflux permease
VPYLAARGDLNETNDLSETNEPDENERPEGMHVLEYRSAAGRWVLLATVLGSSLAFIDATVVNIALSEIGRDLGADSAGLQWTVNGYALSLASLILLGGSLSDRFGRRRVFLTGVAWFAVASLLCGLAPTRETLVAARVLQGIGGVLGIAECAQRNRP